MKYVYVLTSSEKDFYYEQFFISVTSLRLFNPNAYIVALIDSKTKEGLIGKRCGYEQIVSEVVTITAPEELSQKEVSRWIKTSMKKYITGDFLYIDCDTVIAGDISHDFPPGVNVGAILDTHVSFSEHHLAPYFEGQDKKIGFTSFETGKRFNGGIIFCRDNKIGEEFFAKWHSLWLYSSKKGIHQDMPPMNQANYEQREVITELNGTWNCQVTHNGLQYLSDAKIIHCFASSIWLYNCPFLPSSIPVLTSVKETGVISSELMEMLKNPKGAFDSQSRILCGEIELDTINSKLFSFLLFVRKKWPRLFKTLNFNLLKIRARTQSVRIRSVREHKK